MPSSDGIRIGNEGRGLVLEAFGLILGEVTVTGQMDLFPNPALLQLLFCNNGRRWEILK